VDKKNLVLEEGLDKLNETLSMREEVLNTNLSKLENESLEPKQKIESLLDENGKLLEKLKEATDLTANRCWNCSSEALQWLNTHHNRNNKGIGFVAKRIVYPVNKKYVGLSENIICFHSGITNHYRYTCRLRKYAME